jgi:hypothetical protein
MATLIMPRGDMSFSSRSSTERGAIALVGPQHRVPAAVVIEAVAAGAADDERGLAEVDRELRHHPHRGVVRIEVLELDEACGLTDLRQLDGETAAAREPLAIVEVHRKREIEREQLVAGGPYAHADDAGRAEIEAPRSKPVA